MRTRFPPRARCWRALALVLMGASLPGASLLGASPLFAQLQVAGFVLGRGIAVSGPQSWLSGGLGRFEVGAARGGAAADVTRGVAIVHTVLDWQTSRHFGVHAHLLAQAEPDRVEGQAVGVFEAYLRGELGLGQNDQLRWRLGHFLLPTSQENVELGWSSPYTLTFSSLNTWIAHEMRLTGLLGEYRHSTGQGAELRWGASLFGGNDALGALLAWRGFALGDRLTTWGEILPLPPLDSLAPGGPFAAQLDRGTQPLGSDLDGHPGWAAHLAWGLPDQVSVQLSHLDNRGDRRLHHGDEYSWQTDFDLLGVTFKTGPVRWAGEALRGSTGMGIVSGPHVQLDFESAYLLASFSRGPWRLTLRHDRFDSFDRDLSRADDNRDQGRAWTVAGFWEPGSAWRLGLELTDQDSTRPGAVAAGFLPNTAGQSILAELRYYFGT